MPNPVVVPKASLSMEEGTILKWLKAEGDLVSKDETLFELETDKAIVEVPSPAGGILLRIISPHGLVKVETVAGWIGQPGDSLPIDDSNRPADTATAASTATKAAQTPAVPATPAARRRARELGVNLRSIQGTGPGGRITQEDVERVAPLEHAPDRKFLARHLSTAWQTIPHIHVSRKMDAQGLIEARRRGSPGTKITDLLLYTLARLLPRFPELTQIWNGEVLESASEIALGFAVDTPAGVVTPVIHNAAALRLREIGARCRELTEGSRSRRLKLSELAGGVFTLTNLGMEGVDFFAPIVNAPQTAILATGRITQEPIIVDGSVTVGWRMWANLAVDHRVVDGATAGRFLAQLQAALDGLPRELDTL